MVKAQPSKGKKEKKKKALSTIEKRKGITAIEKPSFKKGKSNRKKLEAGKKKKSQKKKKKNKIEAESDKATIKCPSISRLFEKLKGLKRILHQDKGANAHLVKNNSKWK
ncbi:hypothetical protein PIB30_089097 [Stylosanthes scabra]|uniref:Uncharacterized protein n=1 Tax=Stylosanthes scabra TaxID=79078 RepID=A0ABU6YT47_9FABA|nr:hypothetical protein [Stylosanthes scabra]